MKKIFSFIVGLVCCGSVAAQQTYTLDQLKQLAIENNYNLHSARNAIQQSKEQQSEAFTKYFPTLSATGAAVTFDKPMLEIDLEMPAQLASLLPGGLELPSNISMWKSGVFGSVSAIQPVFMGGQIINGNKLAKVGVAANEIKLEASEDKVELTTEQYYWQMVSIKEKLHTLSTVHQMLEELEKDVSNKVRVGAVNRNDLLQVQLRKGEVESMQLEAENALATVGQLLAQHVGKANEIIDVSVPDELSNMGKADAPVLPASLRQDHLSALNATPEYRLLEKNVELMTRHGVFTRQEMAARHEIYMENYCHVLHIEAMTMIDMVQHMILNAASHYTAFLCQTIVRKREAIPAISMRVEEALAESIAHLNDQLLAETAALKSAVELAPTQSGPETLHYYHDAILRRMYTVRAIADQLETLTASEFWPYPTYCDLLFSV